MESPVKKIDFTDKENAPFDADALVEIELQKPLEPSKEIAKVVAPAPTIKSEELDEPLLRENPNRFVLFPIKYHEVSEIRHVCTRVECFCNASKLTCPPDLANVQEGRGIFLDSGGD